MGLSTGFPSAAVCRAHTAKLIILSTAPIADRGTPALPDPAAASSSLKFQPDQLFGVNVVTRREPGALWIGGTPYRHSVIVPWVGEVRPWADRPAAELAAADFDAVLECKPEVVIFGSGERLRFVAPALLRSLIDRRVGIETMDTGAACRTYNVLATEGRAVVAALLLEVALPR